MAVYINQPDFPVDFLRPTWAEFDNPGATIDGGVNGMGEAITIGSSGGGFITGTYGEMVLEGPDERHEIINWLGARLNAGRFIVVPILNDGVGPFPIIDGRRRPYVSGIPHSDGSLLSDGSGYSQSTVSGRATSYAAVNAGIINIETSGLARKLRHSDWFSIKHPTKGWRAYRYWDVLERPASGNNGNYQLAISPPLREAVNTNTPIEFARPRFVAKLPRGETIPWRIEAWYSSRPTINFVEAF